MGHNLTCRPGYQCLQEIDHAMRQLPLIPCQNSVNLRFVFHSGPRESIPGQGWRLVRFRFHSFTP